MVVPAGGGGGQPCRAWKVDLPLPGSQEGLLEEAVRWPVLARQSTWPQKARDGSWSALVHPLEGPQVRAEWRLPGPSGCFVQVCIFITGSVW